MSYVVLGRTVKSEYLTLATLFSVGAMVYAAKSGGKKKVVPADQVKASLPLNAGSGEEEELMNSIKNYIAEAEKESKDSKH